MGNGPRQRKFKRLLVLGMDGLDPKLIREFMEQGHLPNVRKLAETGCCTEMATSNPSESPVAWASIATGADAGQHGIFDFIVRRPGTYLPDLSLMQPNTKNVTGARDKMFLPVRTAEGFWSYSSRAGIPTSVIRWPGTFPPEPVSGHLLAGLGVPDLAGRLGRYSFYATAPDPNDEAKEKVTTVKWQADRVVTSVLGPAVRGGAASVPLEVTRRSDGVRIKLGKAAPFDLPPRTWSNWIAVTFKLGLLSKQSGIIKFYLDAVEPDLRLFATPVQVDPAKPAFPITHPDDFAAEMAKRQGPFYTQGIPEDTHAVTDGRVGIDAFLDQCSQVAAERERMFDDELDRFHDGLLAFVFDHSDRLQHMFWATRDPSHPAYDAAFAERYGEVLPELYREMDRILGKAMASLGPDDGLMVMSDHGFGSFRRSVQINTWLVQNGYMRLAPGKDGSDTLFRDVDWSATRAFALGFASIYVNVKGREQHGIVAVPDEYESVMAELSEGLRGMTDPVTGRRPIKQVYPTREIYHGPQVDRGPDLILGFSEGYRASWQMAIGGAPAGDVYAYNTKQWCGDHLVDPSLVPAVFLASFSVGGSPVRVQDVAPTVLTGLGLAPPEAMTGRSLM